MRRHHFVTGILVCFSVFAQERFSSFEVTSIKPAPSDSQDGGYHFGPGGRATVKDFTLKNLMMVGWHVQDFLIVGGPSWLDTDRYDVEATVSGNPSDQDFRRMMQRLLADRFHLVVGHETRQFPGYALVTATSTTHLGAGMVVARAGACIPSPEFSPPPSPGAPPACGFQQRIRKQNGGSRVMQLQGLGVSAELLARMLGNILDSPIANDTNLQGTFDVTLEWSPETDSLSAQTTQGAGGSGPSLFTALQEQLGLKLISRKEPVDVLVVNHAERPSQN